MYASTRMYQRSVPAPNSYNPDGYAPVSRIRNHATIVVSAQATEIRSELQSWARLIQDIVDNG